MILTGDIGGTKTNLAIYANDSKLNSPVAEQSFESKKYDHLETIIQEFLAAHPAKIKKACFGVAGPVINGVSKISNLIWLISEDEIKKVIGTNKVKIINDLEAMAYGTLLLSDKDVEILNAGQPVAHGNISIIAAGTGLGEAFLIRNGVCTHAVPSEGGHTDLAPRNEIEVEFLKFMLKEFEHISYERALSGDGLFNIYRFLKSYRNYIEPDWLQQRFQNQDRNAVISELGLSGEVPVCDEALSLFIDIYGAETGNWALKTMSTGGVFIGGGIAPKILPKLKDGRFLDAFLAKGRLSNILTHFPVKVILNEKAPLLGTVYYAQIFLK